MFMRHPSRHAARAQSQAGKELSETSTLFHSPHSEWAYYFISIYSHNYDVQETSSLTTTPLLNNDLQGFHSLSWDICSRRCSRTHVIKPILPNLNGNKLSAGASDNSAGRRGDQLGQEGRSSQHHPPEMVSPLSSDLQLRPQRLQTRSWPARTHSQQKDHRAAPASQRSGRLPALQLSPA